LRRKHKWNDKSSDAADLLQIRLKKFVDGPFLSATQQIQSVLSPGAISSGR